MTDFDYDLFVIGAGSGGVRAARMAAGYGAKVAIAEEYRIGGTCVIRGCVPKKLMVYASMYSQELEAIAPAYGWSIEGAKFDWNKLRDKIQAEVTRLSGIYNRNLNNSGVKVFESKAVIQDKNHIKLGDGQIISAKYILIATGNAPHVPAGIKGKEYTISSNDIFTLPELPKAIVINGGSFIAIEFAFILKGMGVDVTLVYRGDKVLRGFDDAIRDEVQEAIINRGINLLTNTNIYEILPQGVDYNVVMSDGNNIKVQNVLMALGRKPYIAGLGLEEVGVKITDGGAIAVDEYSKTSVDNIYAVGDVTDRINLTPVAIREGAAVAATLFNNTPTKMDHENVPVAVFSQPPAGTVGLSEQQAREKFGEIKVFKTRFRPMRIALSEEQTKVMMKIVVRTSDDVVVGVHIVGDDAPEMIQIVAIAVKAGLTKAQFDATCAVHPTLAEELVTLK